jgi:hypothetical protein
MPPETIIKLFKMYLSLINVVLYSLMIFNRIYFNVEVSALIKFLSFSEVIPKIVIISRSLGFKMRFINPSLLWLSIVWV